MVFIEHKLYRKYKKLRTLNFYRSKLRQAKKFFVFFYLLAAEIAGYLKRVIIGKRLNLLSRVLSRNRYLLILPKTEFCNSLFQLVGTIGFEPTIPCPPEW